MKGYSVDTVEVNFESLQAGGDGIAGVYRSLLGTLENLESNLQPMLNTWSGEARRAFAERMRSPQLESAA